jgi:hypothetical protein
MRYTAFKSLGWVRIRTFRVNSDSNRKNKSTGPPSRPLPRLRRNELALTLCQWAGMTVEPARTSGKCRCWQDLDPCGHHLQVCQHRASFLWSHQIWQGFFTNEAASIPGVKVVTTTAHGLPHETTTRGKQPDALITVPQPPGLYGPLLYPTSIMGTAGLTLDFTVVHPVGRRGTEYACDENALHRASPR